MVYLGERHATAPDQQIACDTLAGLVESGRHPAILAEMFQLPFARQLQAYSDGKLDDAALRRDTEWDARWKHDWTAYLPIWQLAQRHHLPLLPLRNSSESGKHLGEQGADALTSAEREGLAPPPYEFGPGADTLRATFEAHGGSAGFERFLKVQTLWEEFMAARIRLALARPERPIVVLVGKGHLLYGSGLPARVQAGWSEPLRQRVLAVDPDPKERARFDAWWTP